MNEYQRNQIKRHEDFIAREQAKKSFRVAFLHLQENDYTSLLNLMHEHAHNLGYEMIRKQDDA